VADNPTTSPQAVDRALAELTAIKGASVIKAVAATDIYAEGPLSAVLVVSPVAPK